MLTGHIFDDRGKRMSPTHSRKGAVRHRYYVSSALIQGQPQSAGSVTRVPAAKVEAVIVEAVRRHLGPDAPADNVKLITMHVDRIVVKRTEIAISLLNQDPASEDDEDGPIVLTVPWSKSPHRRRRDLIVPKASSVARALPIRSDTRAKLVTAIARGRQWLSEIEAGTVTIEGIAAQEACSTRHVNMTISLAFLAPGLIKAAVEGRLPQGIGVARLPCAGPSPVFGTREAQLESDNC
jgi:site-specific DNA recombinase